MIYIERKLEVAWAGSFYDDPALLVWTDLSALWTDDRTLGVRLGRDSDLASTPQAGSCRFRLIAVDGAGVPTGALTPGNVASPFYPNVVSGVPVRVSAKDATGTWHPVFYGLTESFDPDLLGDVPDWTVVTIQCVSAWAYLTAAGSRRTYADRVVGDLAPAKGEEWAAGIRDYGNSTMLYVANGVIYGGATNYNVPFLAWPNAYEPGGRWGFAWLKLDNIGGKAWSVPGAACPVIETGGADLSGAGSGGFASDRAGGQLRVRPDGTCGVSAGDNYTKMQAFIGRPPTQLAPVGVSAPTSTVGWVADFGTVTLVASSSLPHLPRTTAYDPVTKVTSAGVIDGPANAITWVTTASGLVLRLPVVPVTAGKSYGPILVTTGASISVTVEWLNGASTVLSTSISVNSVSASGTTIHGRAGAGLLAPAGAVNARIVVTNGYGGAQTVTVGCVGFSEADTVGADKVTPARWWPIGADAKIWAWTQWPDLGMTTGTAGQIRWLHVKIDVTAWNDAALHMLAWNGSPGVAGKPVVWADGARVTIGWTASYPGVNAGIGYAPANTYHGSAMGGGVGSFWDGTTALRVNTVNPSVLSVPAALLGASRYEVTPDDTLIARAFSFFGGRKSLSNTYATDTGAQMNKALDQLGWPDALRAISTGASTLATTWTDLSALSDYSALIGDLTKAEYGWVDIGPDGKLVWLPRAWYGVGTATAVAHYTWRTPTMGKTAYSPPLDVRWDDKDTANSVVVTNGVDIMARSRQDLTAQRRGLRRLEVTLPGGATQTNVDAVADILFAVHAPGPRVESLTLKAFGPDDPMLAAILARRTGDVVLVDLPQLPAPDLTVPMLITSIEHTSDGQTWTAKFGLGVCPIPAVFTWVDTSPYLDIYQDLY